MTTAFDVSGANPVSAAVPRFTAVLSPVENPIISVRALTKTYKGGSSLSALDNIEIDLPRGKFTAILGTSGSGKSSLLHCLAGLDTFDSGQVWVDGQELSGMTAAALSRFRRETVGIFFQDFNLVPSLNVLENIELSAQLLRRQIDSARLHRLLAELDLLGTQRSFPQQLTGAQQQKVACARVLLLSPPVIFADEPTGKLDSDSSAQILSFLQNYARLEGQTVVLSTHEPEVAQYADQVLFLRDGRIIGQLVEPTRTAIWEAQQALEPLRETAAVFRRPADADSRRPEHSAQVSVTEPAGEESTGLVETGENLLSPVPVEKSRVSILGTDTPINFTASSENAGLVPPCDVPAPPQELPAVALTSQSEDESKSASSSRPLSVETKRHSRTDKRADKRAAKLAAKEAKKQARLQRRSGRATEDSLVDPAASLPEPKLAAVQGVDSLHDSLIREGFRWPAVADTAVQILPQSAAQAQTPPSEDLQAPVFPTLPQPQQDTEGAALPAFDQILTAPSLLPVSDTAKEGLKPRDSVAATPPTGVPGISLPDLPEHISPTETTPYPLTQAPLVDNSTDLSQTVVDAVSPLSTKNALSFTDAVNSQVRKVSFGETSAAPQETLRRCDTPNFAPKESGTSRLSTGVVDNILMRESRPVSELPPSTQPLAEVQPQSTFLTPPASKLDEERPRRRRRQQSVDSATAESQGEAELLAMIARAEKLLATSSATIDSVAEDLSRNAPINPVSHRTAPEVVADAVAAADRVEAAPYRGSFSGVSLPPRGETPEQEMLIARADALLAQANSQARGLSQELLNLGREEQNRFAAQLPGGSPIRSAPES